MKRPSKNVSKSLRGQRQAGLSAISPEVGSLKRGGVSMTVPGEGMTETPPGKDQQNRSAAKYAEPMGRKVR